MSSSGKIYFASDLHLGTPDFKSSAAREKLFVQWLDEIKADAGEIFIIGDIFDFWHEYKTVVPKGFVRIQGKLAELCDAGIPVHIFTGNHDLWMFGYFEQELGAKVYTQPTQREFFGKKFFIGHGDGLGPGDHGYKFIKRVFSNPVSQFFFRWLHPDVGSRIANYFSYESRFGNEGKKKEAEAFKSEDKEWLVQFCKQTLKKEHFDFFVFGHRHLPLDVKVGEQSRYINTGDWLDYYSYAVFDGEKMELKYYKASEPGT
ncbi:MAG TPA: UDP-2,3-diacylglucosamine diphosphatase [Chitinophagales bacterium]|nr:UDP-2,3-diacylglucosamine diphosphatase [Chitinophagales bacterium]